MTTSTKLPEFKKMGFRIIPRIMPESYPNHTSNFPILNLGSFATADPVFCEHKSFLRSHSPRAMPPAASEKNPTAAAPCSSTLQWHTNMPTPKRTRTPLQVQHPEAAPCRGTSGPAPERTGHSYSSTLQQQRAAAPCTSTLAASSSITFAPPPAG